MNDSMGYISFSVENVINNKRMENWMQNNWHLSVFFAVFYLASIFWIRRHMKVLPPLCLNGIFLVWNLALAIFSIFGSIRMLPILFSNLTLHGIFGFTCYYADIHQTFVFWIWLFAFSKVLELGDTVFIILRKKNLLFLHYYYHSLTLIVTWIQTMEVTSLCLWCASINYLVHAFRYTYFTVGLLKWRIPRIVAMLITSLQFIQMLLDVSLTLLVIIAKYQQYNCKAPNFHVINVTLIMYLSYVILFGKLFRDKYLSISKNSRKAI